MKVLYKQVEIDALRNYLLEHTVKDLADEIGCCAVTAKKIADTFGGCEVRKSDLRAKLLKVLDRYIDGNGINPDASGNSQIDSASAVRRAVLIELIQEQLEYFDNDQLKDQLAHLIRNNEVDK
jgi:hypothetical protein